MMHSPFALRAARTLRTSSTTGLLLLLLCAVAPAADTCSTPNVSACCVQCRPQDEIWLLDVRDTCCDCSGDCDRMFARLKVSQFEHCANWTSSDFEQFVAASASSMHTVVWVHGNRVERGEARSEGLQVYRSLIANAANDQPIRFVIWSWPSARIRGPLRDVREKAERSDPSAAQLACVLNRLDPESRLGLIGFSFGARVVTGALHHLSGTPLNGFPPLVPAASERAPIRAVLMAAALDDDWLFAGRYHGNALSQVESLLLLNNSCDNALKRYRHLDRCSRAEALGYRGLPCNNSLGEQAAKVHQFDAACYIGRDHSGESYYCNSTLMGMAWSSLAADHRTSVDGTEEVQADEDAPDEK